MSSDPGTTNGLEPLSADQLDTTRRMLGMEMIQRMPPRGLSDAIRVLLDVYDRYYPLPLAR